MNYIFRRFLSSLILYGFFLAIPDNSFAQNAKLMARVDQMADQVEPKVIEWRRHFHQYPELSNREFKTAEKVAAHLTSLSIEVQTGVAHTGVVGILRGDKPGPVVALRADMDALPVTEVTDVPFASTVKTMYNGEEVGVMHACGHDSHIAILMGVAEILSQMKKDLKGTVKFIFQPAEEGAPEGEEGGAALMVKLGVMENPSVDVIFGLHINSFTEAGTIKYKPEGFYANADYLTIRVKGKQVHGAYPWAGVDPIVVSAQIINGLQPIISRQTELTEEAAVITIGKIQGGVRSNIIPEQVEMIGTIRTLSEKTQEKIHESIKLTATKIAESAGASAEVIIEKLYPVTYNDPELTEQMLPTLRRVAGAENLKLAKAVTGAEDFSFYQQKVPGLFISLGGMPKGQDPDTAPRHHTPNFYIDDSGLKLGVRALTNLTLDYMEKK
jgi:amidohydrolase